MMMERGLTVDHTTISRWVQRYAPERNQRCKPHPKVTNDSWRVDETSIKIKKMWTFLYRAVDSQGKRHAGVSLEPNAGCRGRQTLLPHSLAVLNSFNLLRLFEA
jgi:transposase-like protein